MNHSSCYKLTSSLRGDSGARFPDLNNPPKLRWRDALAALASPALRMHSYRNLHKSMFYEAVCDVDCRERK